MMRPEDAPEPEQEKSQGIGSFVKGMFGGGGGGSEGGEATAQKATSESQATASRIAEESKEGRGTVTTSSSATAQSTNTYKVDTKESDEKWDQARSLTAKAQEQSRVAQTKHVEASATQRESAEAMRRAEIARGADQELQARIKEMHPEEAQAQYQEISMKMEHAKGVSAGKRAELDRLEREMADLNDELNRKTAVLQGEVDTTKAAQHEVDDIDAKIARIKDAVKSEEAQALDNRKRAEALQKEAKAARATAKGQQEAASKAQAAVKELQRQLEEAKRSADGARRKTSEAEHKAEDAESELSDIEKAASHFTSEAENDKAKIPPLEKAKAEAITKLKGAQSKLQSATKDAEAKAGGLKDREGVTSGLKDALAKIQSEEKAKKEQLLRAKAEHEKAEADLKPLQAERERQRRILTSEEEQAKELELKFKSFRIEADRAQARKEELWTKAQAAGESADKLVDEGYVKLGGDKELTKQGEKTKRVAAQTGEAGKTVQTESSSVSAHEIKTSVKK